MVVAGAVACGACAVGMACRLCDMSPLLPSYAPPTHTHPHTPRCGWRWMTAACGAWSCRRRTGPTPRRAATCTRARRVRGAGGAWWNLVGILCDTPFSQQASALVAGYVRTVVGRNWRSFVQYSALWMSASVCARGRREGAQRANWDMKRCTRSLAMVCLG